MFLLAPLSTQESYLISDATARKEQLRKTEQILMEEMPVIPIFHYTMLHANSDRLHDVVLTNSGHIDFKWAYVEK